MLGLFSSSKLAPGWMVVGLMPEGVCLTRFEPKSSAKPVLLQCRTHAVDAKNASAFAKLAKEIHINRYRCTTLLGPQEYKILQVEAPTVPPEELKSAVRWRIKDMLDYHVDDAMIDVLDVPQDKSAPSRNHSMYAIATRNDTVREKVRIFEGAGVPLSVIDVPEMAQRNIAALVEDKGRGLAMLSFDPEGGALLTFTYQGELYLARRIEVSWEQLRSDSGQRRQGFDKITLELQRSLDHFDRQYHFITIAKLVLAPLPEEIGLQQHLAAGLGFQVEIQDLASVMDLSRAPALSQPRSQSRYFYQLGAGLRSEEKVL